MAAVQPQASPAHPVAADMPSPSPSPPAADPHNPVRTRSARKLPRPGTFSHARLPRPNPASVPRGRSYHGGKPHSPAAQAARDGYFARKAAKLYAERRKAAATASTAPPAQSSIPAPQQPPASPPPALQPSNRTDRDVEVINITVDATGFKIDDQKKMRTTSTNPSRKNSRARMTRSSSRQRNTYNRPPEDKENLITDARLEAHIEAYFNRKRAAAVNGTTNAPPPLTTGHTENSSTSNHSWDGSMPKRRASRSVIERDHAINQRANAAALAPKLAATATSPLPKSLQHRADSNTDNCEPNHHVRHVHATQSTTAPPSDELHTISTATSSETTHIAESSEQSQGEGSTTQLPSSGKWCDDCAGVGLHISALLSELEAQRGSCDAATNNGENQSSSSSGSKKGWKSMVTQTVLGDSKSKSASEKTRLVQQINVLRATVDFLYKKIERLENGNNDNASATSATSR